MEGCGRKPIKFFVYILELNAASSVSGISALLLFFPYPLSKHSYSPHLVGKCLAHVLCERFLQLEERAIPFCATNAVMPLAKHGTTIEPRRVDIPVIMSSKSS